VLEEWEVFVGGKGRRSGAQKEGAARGSERDFKKAR